MSIGKMKQPFDYWNILEFANLYVFALLKLFLCYNIIYQSLIIFCRLFSILSKQRAIQYSLRQAEEQLV